MRRPAPTQPLHIVFLVYTGLWVGEIFDLEPLALACATEERWDFLFLGASLSLE